MFKGSFVAIVTPFNDDLSINYEKFCQLIKWHIEKGTDGIVVSGTTGEASTLSDEEKFKLFELAVKTSAKRIPIIAGAGSNYTEHSLHIAKKAKHLGVDGLLLINPYYNKCNHEGMYQHFARIASNVDLPIMLYNVPSRTGQAIPIAVIQRLVKDFNNIVAIKDAGGDFNYSLKIASIKKLALFAGDDNLLLPILALGGQGVVSVAANILPTEFAAICHLYFAGQSEKALELAIKYQDLVEKLFIEVNPIPIKEAMNLKGHLVGGYRLPLTPMTEVDKAILLEALGKI